MLVVDDELVVARMYARMLSGAHVVTVATDGLSAAALVASQDVERAIDQPLRGARQIVLGAQDVDDGVVADDAVKAVAGEQVDVTRLRQREPRVDLNLCVHA